MARHAQLTVATDMPVYFAHPHSPWERSSNDNTVSLGEVWLLEPQFVPHRNGRQNAPFRTAMSRHALRVRRRATFRPGDQR